MSMCDDDSTEISGGSWTKSSVSGCLSWSSGVSDESLWTDTTDATIAEVRSEIAIDSSGKMIPLRSINARLVLETTRAAFWEILAKRALSGLRMEASGQREPGEASDDKHGVDEINAEEAATRDSSKNDRTSLDEVVAQMHALGSSLDALKVRASEDQRTILALKEEVKRTDRLKAGYKRQVAELKVKLETREQCAATQTSSSQGEVVQLQRKLAEMRVLVEGLKRERDSAHARADVAQGEHDELKGRYHRREQALLRAQRRCRDLEDALSRGKHEGVEHEPTAGAIVHRETQVSRCDASTCMLGLQNGGDRTDEVLGEPEDRDDTTDGTDQPADETRMETTIDETNEILDEEDMTSAGVDGSAFRSDAYISTACPAYRRIFGEASDLDAAAHVLISADDALAKCTAKIMELNQELDATRAESHELKSQCAQQYDRAFKYKAMASSLATKVKTLEAHFATVKHSADEYQRQMEHLVQRQRAAAADESHKLESEIQTLSQEQARLLLKLHATQLDLDKSRAVSSEMSRRCEALEGHVRAMGSGTGRGDGREMAQEVRQLESIAAGLKSLAGDPIT